MLPLVEFTYYNNYQTTIQMLFYEAFHGRWCSLLYQDELEEKDTLVQSFGSELAQRMIEDV